MCERENVKRSEGVGFNTSGEKAEKRGKLKGVRELTYPGYSISVGGGRDEGEGERER